MDARPAVLVVDDDPDIRLALAEFLIDEGFRVRCAANGREALQALAGDPGDCLILLDLMMPIVNGWQFLDARARDPALARVPVIVITAQPATSGPLAGPVLPTPLELRRLLDAIRRPCH